MNVVDFTQNYIMTSTKKQVLKRMAFLKIFYTEFSGNALVSGSFFFMEHLRAVVTANEVCL